MPKKYHALPAPLHIYFRSASMLALVLLCTLLAAGCASTGGRSYTKSQARTAQSVKTGTITSIIEATIEEDSSLLGPAIGGVAGGVLGNTMGRGTGKVLTTVGGAALGALAGAAADKFMRSEKAYEFTINLDSGQTVSVVQSVDDQYSVGDRVRVLYSSDGSVRVVRQ